MLRQVHKPRSFCPVTGEGTGKHAMIHTGGDGFDAGTQLS